MRSQETVGDEKRGRKAVGEGALQRKLERKEKNSMCQLQGVSVAKCQAKTRRYRGMKGIVPGYCEERLSKSKAGVKLGCQNISEVVVWGVRTP